MIFALSLNPALAFNCANNPAACDNAADARDLINGIMGAGTIADGGSRPFRFKTASIAKKFAQVQNRAEAGGCTVIGVVGGSYTGGTWTAATTAPSTQNGTLGGGAVSGTDSFGFPLGNSTGVYSNFQFFMDVDNDPSDFEAGIYVRTAGNTGYMAGLLVQCPSDAPTIMDPWYDGDLGGMPASGTLIFQKYLEGSSFDKYLEIKNTGGATQSLANCSANIYSNGSPTVSNTLALSSIQADLDPDEVLVLCHGSSSLTTSLGAPPHDHCDAIGTSVANFNGDDALSIICDGSFEDVIGQIGHDPGSEWGNSTTGTANAQLHRCDPTPDTDGTNEFAPGDQWVEYDDGEALTFGESLPVCD